MGLILEARQVSLYVQLIYQQRLLLLLRICLVPHGDVYSQVPLQSSVASFATLLSMSGSVRGILI